MSLADPLPRPAACPACVIGTPELDHAVPEGPANLVLSLPTIHCAACISTVENRLNALPGVKSARVNLSLKRVNIDARPDIDAAQLIAALAEVGYPAQELDPGLLAEANGDAVGRDLLMRLAVAGFAMMNVMLLSVAVWSGADNAIRDMMHWVSAMIALPAIAFSAQPFFLNGWRAVSVGRLNMDVPISLAILLAGGMSLYETTQSGDHAYFDAALSLTFFLLGGRYLDHRTRRAARSAAQELAALEVPRALKRMDGTERLVPVAELVVGDEILVRPGTRVPVDATVLAGESEVDRAFLTGESRPAYAGPGSDVAAGEINLTGPLTLTVQRAAANSSLQKMAELVALAETARNRYTSLADRAAEIYAPGVHLLAAVALVFWWAYSGDFRLALNIAIAVLIITCPCALGLAVPAVTTAASGRLYRMGLLLKSATALERLAEVDTIVFDKTGTLTLGTPVLLDAMTHGADALALAAALADKSDHPLAQALTRAAADQARPPLTKVTEVPGYGIEGRFQGQRIRLGRASWLGAAEAGETATYLQIDGDPALAFTFRDRIRPGGAELVSTLQDKGMAVHMLTGDGATAARAVASELGITNITANATPDSKQAFVADLATEGHKVLMVGDGFNDTAALAAAHVSLSPASAIDAARTASDIVLIGDDFTPVAHCLDIAVSARRRILENFAQAALYNLFAIPIALAGFTTPLLAALAMSVSSITVTLNSWRVGGWRS